MLQSLYACSTPVFRYALARWLPDSYDVIIFHRAPLSLAEQKLVAQLRAPAIDPKLHANLKIKTVNVSAQLEERFSTVYESLDPKELPALVLQYPRSKGNSKAVWLGRLIPETVQTLVNSPVRREISRHLMAGDVAVWVLVECGHQDRDDEATRTIETELEALEKELNRPNSANSAVAMNSGMEPLRYSFSLIRVSRTDPAEKVLVAMLLNSEPDLHKYADQPMAFPIFGRGRVLYALVGRGIVKNNIKEALYFLSGPCACEIKGGNPGIDLLMAVNWDKVLKQPLVVDEPLPLLTGVLPLQAKEDEDRTMATVQGETGPEDFDSGIGLVGTVILVFAGMAVFVIFASRKIK